MTEARETLNHEILILIPFSIQIIIQNVKADIRYVIMSIEMIVHQSGRQWKDTIEMTIVNGVSSGPKGKHYHNN
nr:hypothetical protein Iba_chr12dCG6240 [Ipomoea batatas]GMD70320.1 hypothetical protein Iba_chr12eCG5150 [Ipomoea batatas]